MPACNDTKMAALSPRDAAGPTSQETLSQTNTSMERSFVEGAVSHIYKTPFGDFDNPYMKEGAHSGMLNPMFEEMEKSVAKTTEILEKINREMENERKTRIKKRLSSHIPEALQGGGESLVSVLRKVEQLIFFEEIEGTDEIQLQENVRLQELDQGGKTSLIANSFRAYLTTLEELELKRVTSKIFSDCQLWLSRLFRFDDSCVVYHNDERDGLVRICRLALYHRYPKYVTDGFDALYSRPPVIYLSAAARPGLGHYLCLQLGLPLSCICTVPCNTMFGASSKMDVAMLEKLIQDDIAAAKTPVLLLAFAGTPVVGHVDSLQRLQEICRLNNIWLHVEGSYLATLTLFSVPTEVSSAKSGDSMTLNLSTWLGLPGLPYATLFKESDVSLIHAAGLSTFNTMLKLDCLPIWMCLQTLGHQGIVDRITYACDLAKLLYDKLDGITTIKQISREKKPQQREYRSIMEILSKTLSALLVFEMVSPTVVFRYSVDEAGPGAVVAPYAANKEEDEIEQNVDHQYYDALNVWLAETLQVSDPKVPVETVEVEKEGVCIRYCPLETCKIKGTTKEDMEHFVESLLSNLSVLNASTLQRKHFQAVVESQQNLQLVHLQNWAGLGAVSYIPDMFLRKDMLTEEDEMTINNLNAELVHQLKTKDTAFSTGQTEDGLMCVKFGLITEETDVEELIQLVQTTGKEVEESSKFLETMSEMIRQGIEKAQIELQKESEEKLMHEGVLRQVPLVGSLLNWLSPIKEDVKGRSFHLTSGKIISTEDTYKYHIQIQEEGASSPTGSVRSGAEQKHGGEETNNSGVDHESVKSGGAEHTSSSSETEGSTTAGQVKAHLISQALASPGLSTNPDPNHLQAQELNQQAAKDRERSKESTPRAS